MSSGRVFGTDQRKRIVPACIPCTRLYAGEMFAEIVEDRRSRPPLLVCVVQRQGSPEILFLGQFRSESEAEFAANEFMSDYLTRQVVRDKREQSGKREIGHGKTE